ncbi:hypothetical protein [Massilicoli timonensis]|uniref:hypothetical protein n=1 Tax=Massilicoli timonensis TaxID=2015901 RepID=UPI0015E133F1|nr:hypothetical protein [Massilicoli timonensis]
MKHIDTSAYNRKKRNQFYKITVVENIRTGSDRIQKNSPQRVLGLTGAEEEI